MDTTAREETSHDERPGGGPPVWSITVVHHRDGALLGQRVVLELGSALALGRQEAWFGPGALDDPRISRSHARISVDAQGAITIEDLGSRNGTRVNGAPVDRAALAERDVIGIGSILLFVHRAPAVYRVFRDPVIAGQGHAIARVLDEIERVAPHPTTVLVLGETGTGKELVARALHQASGRRGPFCAMNCGALPDTLLHSELFGHVRGSFSGADTEREGLAEAASGGTLFLDEIGDASPAFQLALLRFLENGEVRRLGSNRTVKVSTRVVAATHRDLPAIAASGGFREDSGGPALALGDPSAAAARAGRGHPHPRGPHPRGRRRRAAAAPPPRARAAPPRVAAQRARAFGRGAARGHRVRGAEHDRADAVAGGDPGAVAAAAVTVAAAAVTVAAARAAVAAAAVTVAAAAGAQRAALGGGAAGAAGAARWERDRDRGGAFHREEHALPMAEAGGAGSARPPLRGQRARRLVRRSVPAVVRWT
ncbi:MAG: sigma-54-dependent Fis family transcriptional regulator [Minicystis sp.]